MKLAPKIINKMSILSIIYLTVHQKLVTYFTVELVHLVLIW